MFKKIISLFLSILILSFFIVGVCAADVQIKGKTQLSPGDTSEYIISINGCDKASSASVDISCGDGLTVQSGSFLKEGSLKFFDLKKNKGAIGGLTTDDINGEFFKFTVKAENDSKLSRNFTVTVTAKNGAKEVFNQSSTLVSGSTVASKTSSKSIAVSSSAVQNESSKALTVSSGAAKNEPSQTATVSSDSANTGLVDPKTDTTSEQTTASDLQNDTNGSQIDDTAPVLYVILAVAAVAVAALIIFVFKKINKKIDPQD